MFSPTMVVDDRPMVLGDKILQFHGHGVNSEVAPLEILRECSVEGGHIYNRFFAMIAPNLALLV